MNIHSIYYDPNFADCYGIYVGEKNSVNGLHDCLSLSENCTSPVGVSQWCQGQPGPHNGKKISFDELPQNVKDHAIARLTEQ